MTPIRDLLAFWTAPSEVVSFDPRCSQSAARAPKRDSLVRATRAVCRTLEPRAVALDAEHVIALKAPKVLGSLKVDGIRQRTSGALNAPEVNRDNASAFKDLE